MGEVSASTDADDILFSMQNSVWGGEFRCSREPWTFFLILLPDMLVEAAEEDEKL